MAELDSDDYQRAIEAANDPQHKRLDRAPQLSQKLGRFSIMCLILNRTIGSGIFVVPGKILQGAGSVGVALVFWAFGGFIATCALLVWLELGLSVPLATIVGGHDDEKKNVPRSGGEKNFIEFIFDRPRFLATCEYGTVFIILGNLSGNGIAFGEYCLRAAGVMGPEDDGRNHRGGVIGVAIAAMTGSVLLHNNCFAVFKVCLLLTIIIMGLVRTGKHRYPEQSYLQEANVDSGEVVSSVNALVLVLYVAIMQCSAANARLTTFNGFKQPFYVLGEVRSPRRLFPSSTLTAMLIVFILFMLVNVAYFAAIPVPPIGVSYGSDFASLLLGNVFKEEENAQRAMAALIAVSIFGNILVMTFTAARVKQEIAKEGVIPFSLFFATSYTTPVALFQKWRRQGSNRPAPAREEPLEQVPMPAFALHWFTSVLLIAITSYLAPNTAYSVLVELYSWVIVVGVDLVVSGGLLYLTFAPSREWSRYCNFKLAFRPAHTVVLFLASGFLLFAAFAKPRAGDTVLGSTYKWFITPTIGLSAWTWGLFLFCGLHVVMRYRGERLEVTRVPLVEKDEEMEGQWIQRLEVVTHEWHADTRSRRGSPAAAYETHIAAEPKAWR